VAPYQPVTGMNLLTTAKSPNYPDNATPPTACSLAPRLVIADPGLSGLAGHHLAYSQAIARAAQARGMPTLLLAARSFRAAAAGADIVCRPWFVTRYQNIGAGGPVRRALYASASRLPPGIGARVGPALRSARRLWNNRGARTPGDRFGPELVAALREFPRAGADIVLAHSVSAANIESLDCVTLPPSVQALHIVLRRPPHDMNRDDGGQRHIAGILQRAATRHAGRLHLHADTTELAHLFADATGLAVSPVPLPVQVPPVRTGPIGTPPCVLFPGGARLEKGYALLPPIVERLRGRAAFLVHAGVVDAASDPIIQRAHRALLAAAGPGLTIIEGNLTATAYAEMLARVDLMLLPYSAAAYGARSSGILAEALALGIPAVVPAGCWMAEMVAAGQGVAFTDSDRVIYDIENALNTLPELTAAARACAPQWRARNSPDSLLTELLAS